MKCKNCNGTGNIANGMWLCCECEGTGYIEDEMPQKMLTNEEYIRQCSTEELAEFITKVILSDRRFRMTMVGGVEETKGWLKEKHNDQR